MFSFHERGFYMQLHASVEVQESTLGLNLNFSPFLQ